METSTRWLMMSRSASHGMALLLLVLALEPRGIQSLIPASSFLSRASSVASPYSYSSLPGLSMAQIPTLDDWEVLEDGSVVGTVTNHPSIDDGDVIATSPLANPKAATTLAVVTTMSGSRYKLGLPSLTKEVMVVEPPPKTNGKTEPPKPAQPPARRKPLQSISVNPEKAFKDAQRAAKSQYEMMFSRNQNWPLPRKPSPASTRQDAGLAEALMEAQRVAKTAYEKALADAKAAAFAKYELSGIRVGEYMLSGKPQRSTSGKSQIWTAYRTDEDGLPTGDPVIIKMSPVIESLQRESENYKKVTSGFAKGQFVKFFEYLPQADSSPQFSNHCAIIMEKGHKDLKEFLTEQGGALQGNALRDAAMAAAQCLQALHGQNMVWTDLKTENFVVSGQAGRDGGLIVKGIDLESAMPYRDNPVDYSPEACPPEFAAAFLAGNGPYFVLDYSYDVWSFGMMLYELSTGNGAFDGQTPAQVTKSLSTRGYDVDLDLVSNPKLRNLIKACLRSDPKKRPSITQIMLHSYFLTSYSPFSF